ncbi:mediator of RNA polymerase II transcription subunit 15-like [Phymastichus coffea]|uniref:mediator of RNA polymerase II transcription subunit 15-like n=1 Tax=Phymastichus coffea TaxID=108790 RepID=UPI00273B5905|nr:mediator of RNA polymerase II transcription subunit 15-like [Phymastichus coffea]
MWRLIFLAALLGDAAARPDELAAVQSNAKRSALSAYAAQQHYAEATQQQIPEEYLVLLQRYLESAQPAPPGPAARPTALELEQYHVETSPRAALPQLQQPLRYYEATPAEPQPQPPPQPQPQPQPEPGQLQYHRSVPIQYGYEDEQQVQREQQSPAAIVRAQAQAQAAALAFQKVAQAAHHKHREAALEQIRLAGEKHREQSALEQIRQGEAVSEAGLKERLAPADEEAAYKARLRAQATALVAEQRRAKEAAEYKAHAEAILKLQAQQRAHLRAQEEAHHFALNYEKNQQRAQAQAQAVANAQALALYKARQQALAKAQAEAKQAAKAQADARKLDPDSVPVVQYLLPNKVALPPPEVYLPKAAEALRAQAAQEKRLKKPLKQLLVEEVESADKGDEQQLAFLVDAAYYRKQQQHQQLHQQQQQQQPRAQYLQQDVEAARYPAQYQQLVDPDKLALLLPVEA